MSELTFKYSKTHGCELFREGSNHSILLIAPPEVPTIPHHHSDPFIPFILVKTAFQQG